MDAERYERIAKQVNEAIGSDLTAEDVRDIDQCGIKDDALPAYTLAAKLLNDE